MGTIEPLLGIVDADGFVFKRSMKMTLDTFRHLEELLQTLRGSGRKLGHHREARRDN